MKFDRFSLSSLRWFGILTFVAIGCGKDNRISPATHSTESTTNQAIDQGSPEPFELARLELSRGNHAQAMAVAREGLIERPGSAEGQELLGDIYQMAGEPEKAIESYQMAVDAAAVTESQAKPSAALLDKLGRAWMSQSRPFEAVSVLQRSVDEYPESPTIRTDLVGLLLALGRAREAMPHLQWLVQRGKGGPSPLVALADLSRPQTNEAMCRAALMQHPDDLRPHLPLAQIDAHFGRWNEVAKKLSPLVDASPGNLAAVALYGRAITELGNHAALDAWLGMLPEGIEQEPEYWMAAGIHAQKSSDPPSAARSFWEAMRLDEYNAEALSRLVACLTELNEELSFREQLTNRIAAVTRIRQQVDQFSTGGYSSQAATVRIAKELEAMGRTWEAAAWLRVGAGLQKDIDSSLAATYHAIHQKMSGTTPWQDPRLLLAARGQLSRYPAVDWQVRRTENEGLEVDKIGTLIRFEDQSKARGLNHLCKINKSPGDEVGLWIYQSIAGGLGVLDFDLDGWPDLYLTAMDGTPNEIDSSANQLYRNCEGQFNGIATEASVGDRGFAQGVSIGDYNADGFPDIYVANIGINRLYRNNGDGTFHDVTSQMGFEEKRWTTSVAMLDIDEDGNLDIFDVGYCEGKDPFVLECSRDGYTRSCSPLSFSGQRDRVWQGSAEGAFRDVTNDWLGEHSASCGLGIVAGRFDELPGIDVYVANDMAANHFWSSTKQTQGNFSLREQASIRGVAVDSRSLAQASMGIAVADPDADGDFDFFLTNHANEPNVLYEQVNKGIWLDHTERAGLVAPSVPMLGFGTVWFDADNNGTLELMVANGHVDDFTHLGEAYRMPMQLFERREQGDWLLLDGKTIGESFERRVIARNLVNADIDRDGFADAIVTHLFDPVAVLMNRSETNLHSITLFLKGVTLHPDAIGANVSIEVNGRTYRSQLIAGDGFQCSAQRCVRFGVGESTRVDRVIVEWNENQVESFGAMDADNEYLLVQGEGVPFELAKTAP